MRPSDSTLRKVSSPLYKATGLPAETDLEHTRIDEGVKRGPRRQINRKPGNAQDRSGQMVSTYSPDLKAKVIGECHELIAQGYTPAQIAQRHGIPPRTVQYWLLGDETAEAARGQLIAAELARTLDDLRQPEDLTADSPLRLARAREEFRAWSWIAERRQARLYAQKQELTISVQPVLNIAVVQQMPEKIIDGEVIKEQSLHINALQTDLT